jgi:Sortilin, neurotensin receptor 3,
MLNDDINDYFISEAVKILIQHSIRHSYKCGRTFDFLGTKSVPSTYHTFQLSYMRKLLLMPLLFSFAVAMAQKNKPVATPPAPDSDSAIMSKIKYRLVGPWRGGRSSAVAGSYKNRNTFYFGGTGGGVWKSMDGGNNWKNVSDKYFGSTIGAVAVAPSDESVVYAGEGENTMRGNVSEGLGGIWRSEDAGKSWKNIGLKDARHIIRIVIHPRNPDMVWVAAMGHLFGPNEERGVYKTTDGGKSWKRTLFVNNQTGCSDLVMEPGNPSVMYPIHWKAAETEAACGRVPMVAKHG